MQKVKEWLSSNKRNKQFEASLQVEDRTMSVTRIYDNKIFGIAEPVHVLMQTPSDDAVFYIRDFDADLIHVLIIEWTPGDADQDSKTFNVQINHLSNFNRADSDAWLLAQKTNLINNHNKTK